MAALPLMLALGVAAAGCAYYNYFYNAQKYYEGAEKQRREQGETPQQAEKKGRARGLSDYDKCIESAGRMLQYYPDSRWEDDALLLLAKAYYRTGQFRNAIGKADELADKYPESELLPEASLWKGMSMLEIAQPDSATIILTRLLTGDTPVGLRAQAHYALAAFDFKSQRWEAALEQFQGVNSSGTEDKWLRTQALLQTGKCLSELDRYPEAIRLYEEILADKKTDRPLRMETTLQMAKILRQLGRYQESLDALNLLLKDAAYVQSFPDIELELSVTRIEMGDYEEAFKLLKRLTESDIRGETAARAFYLLGYLHWLTDLNFAEAYRLLTQVKAKERNSAYVALADSILQESETLTRFWRRMEFLQGQLTMVDSSRQDLRQIFDADTAYTDSVAILLASGKPEPRGKGGKSPTGAGKTRRLKEEEPFADSLVVADSVVVPQPFDSTALAALDSLRSAELVQSRFDLAIYHLVDRLDPDSAEYHLMEVGKLDPPVELWARSLAASSYIANRRGDAAAGDSLLRVIYQRIPDTQIGRGAASRLGIFIPEPLDTTETLLAMAEDAWFGAGDYTAARDYYLNCAEIADSLSDNRARALLGAAYLSRRVLNQDSLANNYYAMISDLFPRTDYGKLAGKRIRGEQLAARQQQQPEELDADKDIAAGEDFDQFGMDEFTPYDPADVYEAEDVDEPPELAISPEQLQNYVRSNIPFRAEMDDMRGRVVVELVVDAGGNVHEPRVIEEIPEDYEFGDAALKVVERLRYTGGRYRGKRVATRIRQVISFDPDFPGMESPGGMVEPKPGDSSTDPR